MLPQPIAWLTAAALLLAAVPATVEDAAALGDAVAACAAAAEQQRREDALALASAAERALAERLAAHPQDAASLLLRARVALECRIAFAQMLEQGALAAQAEGDLRAALAAAPQLVEARVLLATLLYHLPPFLGRTADAISELELVVGGGEASAQPVPAELYRMLADLLAREGRSERAREVRERGRARHPGSGELAAPPTEEPAATPGATPGAAPGVAPGAAAAAPGAASAASPGGSQLERAEQRVTGQSAAARPASAQLAPAPLLALERAVTARLAEAVRGPLAAGAVAAVAFVDSAGPTVFAAAGHADLENAVAMSADSVVPIGSVSKQMVAAALLRLAAEEKLAIDDPVARWLPEVAGLPPGLTVRHLLSHTGGLPQNPAAPTATQPDWRRATLASATLVGAGERAAYSNFGYALAGEVLVQASGSPRYLEESLLAPLGLADTGWCDARRLTPRRAHGYRPLGNELVNLPFPSAAGPLRWAGGICSTARDLARWAQALHGGRVLPPELYRLMTTPVPVRTAEGNEYGLGLRRVTRDGGEIVLRHAGAIDGFLTETAYWPARGMAVVVVLNAEGGDPVALAGALAALVGSAGAPARG